MDWKYAGDLPSADSVSVDLISSDSPSSRIGGSGSALPQTDIRPAGAKAIRSNEAKSAAFVQRNAIAQIGVVRCDARWPLHAGRNRNSFTRGRRQRHGTAFGTA